VEPCIYYVYTVRYFFLDSRFFYGKDAHEVRFASPQEATSSKPMNETSQKSKMEGNNERLKRKIQRHKERERDRR
jgi:hypothetical protein